MHIFVYNRRVYANSRRCRRLYICAQFIDANSTIVVVVFCFFLEGVAVQFIILYTVGIEKKHVFIVM